MAFCSNCGSQLQDGSRFCESCGAPAGGGQSLSVAATSAPAVKPMKKMDEVEFVIYGDDLQFVEIMLDPGETIVSEAGAMMYMDSAIETDTIFGDGSTQSQGTGLGDKLFSAAKRMLTGESLFINTFRNSASVKKCVAFAAPYPER